MSYFYMLHAVDTIVYHANCLDGLCAAATARLRFPDAKCVPALYGKPAPEFQPGESVLLVDFCYPPEWLIEQARRNVRVTVIDHHVSSEKAVAESPAFFRSLAKTETGVNFYDLREQYRVTNPVTAVFSSTQSGAELTWALFFPDCEAPGAVRYVGDRDMWRWKLDGTDAFTIAAYKHCLEVDDWFKFLSRDEAAEAATQQCIDDGLELVVIRDAVVAEQAQRAVAWDVPGLPEARGWRVDDCDQHVSETGEAVLKAKGGGVVALVRYNPKRKRTEYSLRSDGSVDCSLLAGRFGGGGHAKAAGFSLPDEED